jgi:hypothetical protein
VFGEVLADVRVWFEGSFAEGCAVCRAVHLRRNPQFLGLNPFASATFLGGTWWW